MEQNSLLLEMVMAHFRDDCEIVVLMERLQYMKGPKEVFFHVKSLKDKGNVLFKKGDFELAFQNYEMGAKLISCTSPSFDESLFCDLALSLNLNLAACTLKLKMLERARALCSLVLNFDANNVKARFRRALANIELGLLVESSWDIEKVLEIDPSNKDSRRELERVKNLINVEAKRKRPQNEFQDSSQDRKGKKFLVSEEGSTSELIAPSSFSEKLKRDEPSISNPLNVDENVEVDMVSEKLGDDDSRHSGLTCSSNGISSSGFTGNSPIEDQSEIESSASASVELDHDHAGSTLRFQNRRKRDNSLTVSRSLYNLIFQGKEASFYHSRSGSLMKIRVVARSQAAFQESQPIEVDMVPSDSSGIEENGSDNDSLRSGLNDRKEICSKSSHGSVCSSNNPLVCDTTMEEEVTSYRLQGNVIFRFKSKPKPRRKTSMSRASFVPSPCKDSLRGRRIPSPKKRRKDFVLPNCFCGCRITSANKRTRCSFDEDVVHAPVLKKTALSSSLSSLLVGGRVVFGLSALAGD